MRIIALLSSTLLIAQTTPDFKSQAREVLLEVVTAMSKGQAISVVPKSRRLTTSEAADFLGISRPTLVKLLEGGEIPFEQPSRHRRVLLSDLVAIIRVGKLD